jgi:hypothetical protein
MTISFSNYPWLYIALVAAIEDNNFGRDTRPEAIDVPDVYDRELASAETALASETLELVTLVSVGFLSPLSRANNHEAKAVAERNPALVSVGELIAEILTVTGLIEPDDDDDDE